MTHAPSFDLQAAHRFFAADCFNRAWDLMDKTARTSEDDDEMLRLSLASHWHWTQRADCTPAYLSVGYWQTSRVFVLLKQPQNALHYAQLCLKLCAGEGVDPFYLGYAYEALARAESAAGNFDQAREYLTLAQVTLEKITDVEMRQPLMDDLATIPGM